MSWVSVAVFSLPVSSAAIECNLMILQLESQSRIGLTQRSAISAMASTSIVGELGRGLDLNVVTTP